MTEIAQMQAILALLEIDYRERQKVFDQLLSREVHLRKVQAGLDLALAKKRKQASEDFGMRSTGLDIAHQAWIDRQKREINFELARLLASKENHRAIVRRAFGKVITAQEIVGRQRQRRKKENDKTLLARAISFSLTGR